VEVRGKNLNQGAYDVRMSYRNESVCRNIPTAEISPDLVSYLISHEQRTGDFEFRCHNGGKKALIIECITLKSVNKTEKGSRAVTKLPVLDTGFPFDRQILFSQPDIALFCYGFHSIEPAGRWAAKHAAIEMIFSKMPSSPVQVIFSISPLTKDQIMIIKTPDGKPQKTLKVPCRGTYVHTLDRKYFLNNGRIARIGLSFPNAKKPGTADSRVLSCFFSGIEARLLEDLRAGREVVFNKYSVFFQSGFAVPENWGTWSNEKNCVMRFSLPVDRKSENVHLQFTCQAYAKMKSVKIYCNGKYAAAWNIQKHDPQIYDLKLNVPLTKRNVELRFEQFDVASPQEVTRSSDQRKLGLGFISMRYISENISPGDSILLNTPNLFFRKGFSPSEEWGTWSNEKNCVMRFSLPVDRKSEYVHLQFTCKAYAKMKSVKIYCNGKYAAAWNIRKHDPQVYDLKLNVPLTKRNVELRFEQFDVASPQEVAGSSDRRKLGLGFISLKYISENTVPQGK
ncbi:MAG: hypothetical protein J5858_08705, partial [Lentisphaeria bacterium]|nr:hypothetical protein [Lentisphaeria bacterium]